MVHTEPNRFVELPEMVAPASPVGCSTPGEGVWRFESGVRSRNAAELVYPAVHERDP